MAFLWLVLVVVLVKQFDETVSYSCTLNALDLTCTGLIEHIPEHLTATINKTYINTLKIINAKLPIVSGATFKGFSGNLQTVYLTSSGVRSVEKGSFNSSADLQYLSLRDNELTELDLESPALQKLDVSFNLLQDISRFNISAHPRLKVLNVSYNQLTHLPKEILEKLEQKNDFFLVIDNNPWDCLRPQWIDLLSPKLINVFCTDQSYNISYKVSDQESNEPKNIPKTNCNEPMICLKCSYTFCLVWLFSGIWAGVILGNVGMIKRMVCGRMPMYADKHTQCDYTLVDQHMISAVFDYKSRRLVPISATGIVQSGFRNSENVPFFRSQAAQRSNESDQEEQKSTVLIYKGESSK
ncbi:uncharacterized protein LOC126746271 isoform X2 [Anthonomus grandis grandis]|uniref:uncharacterized protein LOC126746271 isoform X2 n=1 Tax=Anthonomus grandis grandis TaxID=2921223 RepID=UPI00216689D8|nr:uncharacterized protein LOC126746271 isoform X2 [Anthonomus grandis grandis]